MWLNIFLTLGHSETPRMSQENLKILRFYLCKRWYKPGVPVHRTRVPGVWCGSVRGHWHEHELCFLCWPVFKKKLTSVVLKLSFPSLWNILQLHCQAKPTSIVFLQPAAFPRVTFHVSVCQTVLCWSAISSWTKNLPMCTHRFRDFHIWLDKDETVKTN